MHKSPLVHNLLFGWPMTHRWHNLGFGLGIASLLFAYGCSSDDGPEGTSTPATNVGGAASSNGGSAGRSGSSNSSSSKPSTNPATPSAGGAATKSSESAATGVGGSAQSATTSSPAAGGAVPSSSSPKAGAAGTATTTQPVPAGAAGTGTVATGDYDATWLKQNTVALRNSISSPGASTVLNAEKFIAQAKIYDPGSPLRCTVQDDPAYRAAVDTIGGVTWGYNVSVLEDESKPRFLAGFPYLYKNAPAAGNASDSAAVEIEEADIVGISDSSALFFSAEHGLFLVDLAGSAPAFDCATKLPGRVSKFFYYKGHLVVMTESQSYGIDHRSYLLHFNVSGGKISFVESIDLGRGSILDTRRFNDRLVVYSDLTLEDPNAPAGTSNVYRTEPTGVHRTLRVFGFGDKLTEQMNQTLLDTTPSQSYLTGGGISADTAPGTQVAESSSFGRAIWASDHYFVVTEAVTKTTLSSWETRNYTTCVKSHTVEQPYRYCNTIYETRPNPDYVPPDNSGGDRACKGTTLADCLRAVSKVSNPTIQVPVGTKCEDRVRTQWICDESKNGSYTYPQFSTTASTRLYIYEYTDSGFIRLDTKVREISTQGLDAKALTDTVPTLTTSTEAYDLAVPGTLQTLYFQNGFLYAIADGVLQVYSMGDSSMVRTSSLKVVNSGLQTSLFTDDKLYLSDFGYSGSHDNSVLRVVDLTNPAFPRTVSQDRTLPGGHSSIIPTSKGILTIGSVANFAPDIQAVLKLGLFTDPFASELAYLILGTDLSRSYLTDSKAQYFNSTAERLYLPYYGYQRNSSMIVSRVGISHLEADSIASEGAVEVPETPLRVRPKPGSATDVLSFSSNTVEWLHPASSDWATTPLLEYWKPIAIYRVSEQDDYVQVLRLGNRCKLHFANVNTINLRADGSVSSAYDCGGSYPWAYDHNIIFDTTVGVRFTTAGVVQALTAEELSALVELRKQRLYCLFSQVRVQSTAVDPKNLPDPANLKCYTPAEYQAASSALPAQ